MPLSNTKAMDQIHLLLQGLTLDNAEDVLGEITQIVRDTGRVIDGDGEAFIVINLTDNYAAWSPDDNMWVDMSRATTLTARQLETVTIPDPSTAFAIPHGEYVNLSDRAGANLRSALFSLTQIKHEGGIHHWRWLPAEDREQPDRRVEVVWASTPVDPSTLTVQYTLTELNELRMEIGRTRIIRGTRERRREQWGITVGDRLALREAQRAVAIPANRQEGTWEIGTYFDPNWQNPCFYDEGSDSFVVRVTGPDDSSVAVVRSGYAVARSINSNSGEMEEITSPEQFREMFPSGNIDWDIYDSPWFSLERYDSDGDLIDEDAETFYTLDDSIIRAATMMRVRPYTHNREDTAA